MVTENIRDMPNWTYLMEISRDAKWLKQVCPHCIYKADCEKGEYECKERGGFMFKQGASDSENKGYIRNEIGLEIR